MIFCVSTLKLKFEGKCSAIRSYLFKTYNTCFKSCLKLHLLKPMRSSFVSTKSFIFKSFSKEIATSAKFV